MSRSVLFSVFELEHLLLEGHCFEQSSGNPPRGLQFTLGNSKQPVMVGRVTVMLFGVLWCSLEYCDAICRDDKRQCATYAREKTCRCCLFILLSSSQVDTIVMANLGYFQLKANPGAWLLKLRHGRSSDIYSIARLVLRCTQGRESPAIPYNTCPGCDLGVV